MCTPCIQMLKVEAMTEQEFQEALSMLYSKDPMTFEDGYQWLIGYADEYFDQLTKLMRNETNPDLRSKLIEVLGHCTNEKAISVLAEELLSIHRDVRFWAHSQLMYFENPKAEEVAEKYKAENPNEDWY